MAHVWVTLTVIAFFALCWALIIGCDKIIGPDDQSDLAISDVDTPPDADATVAGGDAPETSSAGAAR
jgi:hypothetical protein